MTKRPAKTTKASEKAGAGAGPSKETRARGARSSETGRSSAGDMPRLSTIAGGTTGAMIGAVAGPLGAAVGAAIGAVAGSLAEAADKSNKSSRGAGNGADRTTSPRKAT